MSRVQLALNVDDLDEAIGFYTKLFATEPAKVRPGYANFAVAEPPLKLVLIETPGAGGTLNHLGVEVASTAEVAAAQRPPQQRGPVHRHRGRRRRAATPSRTRSGSTVPSGEPWEIYTVLADAETPAGQLARHRPRRRSGLLRAHVRQPGVIVLRPRGRAADPATAGA